MRDVLLLPFLVDVACVGDGDVRRRGSCLGAHVRNGASVPTPSRAHVYCFRGKIGRPPVQAVYDQGQHAIYTNVGHIVDAGKGVVLHVLLKPDEIDISAKATKHVVIRADYPNERDQIWHVVGPVVLQELIDFAPC